MKRLLLLGGGHAHVQVVHALGADPPPGAEVTLIDRSPLAAYSGMLPGLIAGHYGVPESHVDLVVLCGRARIRFVHDEAVAIELGRRQVLTARGERHDFDLLSLDTGSTPPLEVPGARTHAVPVKPIDAFLRTIERWLAERPGAADPSLAVVGAGAAGFEVVMALEHRFGGHTGALRVPSFRLVSEAARILPGFPERVRRLAEARLREQGIRVHAGSAVHAVDAEGLLLASGERVPARQVVFVTGAAAAPMYRRSGLQTDDRGFVAVDAALQSLSHAGVFASGDAATVIPHPRPKSGVHAVRQGPPLARNLRRVLAGKPPLAFVPQRKTLSLLSTGRRHAIASRGGLTLAGDWVWRWKDRIDRRFVERFTAPG